MANSEDFLKDISSLWIHGAGLSGATWLDLTSDLPRAQMPDLPGHGDAEAVAAPTVERFSDTLLPRVEDDMVLIGHSLGGMVALELLARTAMRPRALILVESVPTVTDRWIRRAGPRLARPLLQCLPRSWLNLMGAAGQSPAAAKEARRFLSQMPRDRILDAFDAARTYDGRRHLAQVMVPTLVIVGSENRATHRGARLSAERIAGAEFEILTGGHLLHIDNPCGLRRSISAFLARTAHRVGPTSTPQSFEAIHET
ncbi:MAG: alpha/beta fold hydrolase [Pseudomonadota bacterium]